MQAADQIGIRIPRLCYHPRLSTEGACRVCIVDAGLRGIVDSLADAVLVCNADDELVLYNPAALRVLPNLQPGREAYALAEVLESPELLELIHEAQASRGRLSREIPLAQELGGQWVLASVAPVTDEQTGSFQGTVTVLRDITELRRVEQVKAQFVNMVAHELRAPLSAIDGYLSVLYEGLVQSVDKQREMLSRSRQRLRALLDLVSDLLEVARMEGGTVRRQIEPQAPAAIVGDVLELMKPMGAQAQVGLENQVPSDLPRIEADREELIRLFTNLVSNAIKYNRPSGAVRVRAAAEGPYVRLDVADTGIGISREGLQLLFSEFFREKRRETARITGTGLGLSIVKRIVDFYHGRVNVTSEEGEGSTFSIWLPRQHVA